MGGAIGDGVAASSQKRPGRRGRTPSADVERELIDAAEAVLKRDGITGLTIRAIADEAGIAQTTVYNRFGEKNALLGELMIRILDQTRAVYASGEEPDMRDRLIETALRVRAYHLANPTFFEIMYEMPCPRGQVQPEVHQHAAAAMAALCQIVELAAAAGVIAIRDNAHAVAQQLWWAMHGAVSLELKNLIVTADRDASYRAYVETLLRGLAPE